MILFKDVEERRAYARAIYRRTHPVRRAAWIRAQGPCRHCGSAESLEVDHIDPATKTMATGAIWAATPERRAAELAKCQVLCNRCHINKTAKEKLTALPHGQSRAHYKRGCRCDACKELNKLERRRERA